MTREIGNDCCITRRAARGEQRDQASSVFHRRKPAAFVSTAFVVTSAFAFVVSLIWLPVTSNAINISFQYHHYDNLTGVMQQLVASYPQLTRMYSIGKSEQGRELWVLVVSKFPNERPLLVPAVKYIGNMHGNEPVSREVIVHFANYLLENYGKLPDVTKYLDKTQVHLLPSLNPDGFELANEGECTGVLGRYNAHLIDINRNFPDIERENNVPLAVETRRVMSWLEAEPFVLSANFHGGALVASFPYDNYAGTEHVPKYSRAPDDDVFRYLATIYASNHPRMRQSNSCGDNFKNGIVNGAEWFQQNGSMQDYNYEHNGVMELTIELGCCKYPASQYLKGYWEENQAPMMRYLQQVHMGAKGMVFDVVSKKTVAGAKIGIVGRDSFVTTTKRGEYFRIVLPGTYEFFAQADGYQPETKTVTVTNEGGPIVSNFFLKPIGYVNSVAPAVAAKKFIIAPPAIVQLVKSVLTAADLGLIKTPTAPPTVKNVIKVAPTSVKNTKVTKIAQISRPSASGALKVIIKNSLSDDASGDKYDDSFPFGQPDVLSGTNPIKTDNTRELLLDDGTPVGRYTARSPGSNRFKAFWPPSSVNRNLQSA